MSDRRSALGPLYLITDRRTLPAGADLVAAVDAALAGLPAGAAVVQLREKELDDRALLELCDRLIAVTRPRGCPLLVNDRVDVALCAGADGVHLPEAGLDVATARRLGGDRFVIGASTHSADAAAARVAAGADLVVCGPVWPTPSKPTSTGIGVDGLRAVATAVAAAGPGKLYALGGVDRPERARDAITAGAHGVAGIRGFLAGADPALATRALWRAVQPPGTDTP